jgi:hypothetical protein
MLEPGRRHRRSAFQLHYHTVYLFQFLILTGIQFVQVLNNWLDLPQLAHLYGRTFGLDDLHVLNPEYADYIHTV